MIFDGLKRVVRQNQRLDNRVYLLNLLKEQLQIYILYFVYTSPHFKDLIFTGGTCLRRIYGLNRLSVDLDLDFEMGGPHVEVFAKKLEEWFIKEQQLKDCEVTVRKETAKVKLKGGADVFPEIGKEVIFVSVDFSPVGFKEYGVENNLVSTPEFSFIVKNFDLPTMFANKINAFLSMEFWFGKGQDISFKARDVYDLFWLCQRSKQSQYQLRPRFERIFKELKIFDKGEVLQLLLRKINLLRDRHLQVRLLPFFADSHFVESFVLSYKRALSDDLNKIFL